MSETKLLAALHAHREHGLTLLEARHRLHRHGPNELSGRNMVPAWLVLLRQFQSPLTIILLIAALVSLWQHQMTDVIVVVAVVVLNSAIGFIQEYRAERTIDMLRRALSASARVIRDGVEHKISAHQVVPGDLVIVEAGDRAPADARILEAQNLRVNEAALTGEAVPAHKRSGTSPATASLAERVTMLYASTFVVDGRAVALVTATGMATEIGQITAEVTQLQTTPTFLQRKIAQFGRAILFVSIILALGVFFFGIGRQIPLANMVSTALSLLVAIVPEGLPVAMTVVLSVGLLRMYRRHALIRKLAAAETLGSATVICIDKTGTVTEGTMMVERLLVGGETISVTGHGYSLSGEFLIEGKRTSLVHRGPARLLLELASLATMSTISRQDLALDQTQPLTDPTETALAVVAAKAGFYAFKEERHYPERLEIPFDQELRYSTSVHQFGRWNRYVTKGSPEKVLHLATHLVNAQGQKRRLLARSRVDLEEQAAAFARQGYRLVALAYGDRPAAEAPHVNHIRELTFVGYFCIADPIRADVRQALATAKAAGIRVIMLTGDHLLTAETIAAKVGLDAHGEAIHASELTHHDLENISVVARATPADKLKIIEKLQRRGEVVAMTGDGVNDAPALKKADIGVAMGRSGTDVAIEAAEMVLLKDNFAAIVNAIEQGRLIWENLRKVIFYLTSTTLAEIFVIVYALVVQLPLPLLAVQILWMNLVTDGIMSIALTVEPAETDLMRQKPRRRGVALVDLGMFTRMLLLSLVMAVGSISVYVVTLNHGIAYARTATLTTMVLFQLFNVFNARSMSRSAFDPTLGRNNLLVISFILAVILQVLSLSWPGLSRLLGTVPLDWQTVLSIAALSTSIILTDELRKIVRYLSLQWAKLQQAFA